MGARARGRWGFAVLVDVVGSTQTADFAKGRARRLRYLSERHLERGWVKAPYTVTAWDEFQTFLWDAPSVPRVILELRQRFSPWKLTIGVGWGDIRGWRSRRPINEAVSGAAFERAREALEALTASKRSKYPRLTRFRTGDSERDCILDLIYGLHDTLVLGVTERQWETIGHALDDEGQEAIAKALGVQTSTVSRNLQRGHYWQMRETLETVAAVLDMEFT